MRPAVVRCKRAPASVSATLKAWKRLPTPLLNAFERLVFRPQTTPSKTSVALGSLSRESCASGALSRLAAFEAADSAEPAVAFAPCRARSRHSYRTGSLRQSPQLLPHL